MYPLDIQDAFGLSVAAESSFDSSGVLVPARLCLESNGRACSISSAEAQKV
jgi:hypothetical protein